MQIDHIAIWTKDLERLRDFYTRYFGATCGEKYVNPRTGFESYFLEFGEGARLELMYRPELRESTPANPEAPPVPGIAHLAFHADSTEEIDRKAHELQAAGFRKLDGPRHTGDGYYEVTFADPDGNQIEITFRKLADPGLQSPLLKHPGDLLE